MLKRMIRRGLLRLGYDLLKVPRRQTRAWLSEPPAVQPRWPLPRDRAISDDQIREGFKAFPHWHYAFALEGGLSFPTAHNNPGLNTDDPIRPLQRFRHFMPYLLDAAGGSLEGKRVLDLGCNSGFWSLQCALLGAQVVGIDARPELIAQANFLKKITGTKSVEFRQLDFWSISAEGLGGRFDVVLNLGLLYHLAEPVAALRLTRQLARELVLVDTALHPVEDCVLYLMWEEAVDIRMAVRSGMVAVPTRRAMNLMLRHVGFSHLNEIPVRTTDLPEEYLMDRRASWLLQV